LAATIKSEYVSEEKKKKKRKRRAECISGIREEEEK